MKKILSLLTLSIMLLTSAVAFAASEETITEGADIIGIKRLAVAMPMHYKIAPDEPNLEEFIESIYVAGGKSRCYILSYREMATNIRKSTGIDINALDENKAQKVYKENVGKFADAYLVVTTANNLSITQFFFEVYNAKDHSLMYLLTIQSRSYGKYAEDYEKACEEFYKTFDAAAERSLKEAAEKEKQEQKKNRKKKK